MKKSTHALKFSFFAIFIIGTLNIQNCGRSRLSDREIRREQIRLNAETKKRELSAIKGDYTGAVDSGSSKSQPVALHLEVVEAPFNDNGGIDPVMMPQLSGFLKFPFSSNVNGDEYLGFKITRGEYDPKRSKLELVVNHDQYGEMQLSLGADVDGFMGSWQALGLSMTGTMKLRRGGDTAIVQPGDGQSPTSGTEPTKIAGSYTGFVNDDVRSTHYAATIQIRATNVAGQGLKLSADVRLARGDEANEFAIWKFDTVDFHPLTRRLSLRKDGVNETFLFTLNNETLSGEWSSAILGRMGVATLNKSSTVHSDLPRAKNRTGKHEVCLVNFGGANLPENAALTMTVTPDVASDGKVHAQSTIVFYLGAYDSPDRVACSLAQVDLDYISGRFQGVCGIQPNMEPFTISGMYTSAGFEGKLTASGSRGADLRAGRCKNQEVSQ